MSLAIKERLEMITRGNLKKCARGKVKLSTFLNVYT